MHGNLYMYSNASQKIIRIILGILLIPLFGDIFILLFLGKLSSRMGLGTYLIALIFTIIPTLIYCLIIEYGTKKLAERWVISFIFAVILGCYLNEVVDFLGRVGLYKWVFSSIFAVILTECVFLSISKALLYLDTGNIKT